MSSDNEIKKPVALSEFAATVTDPGRIRLRLLTVILNQLEGTRRTIQICLEDESEAKRLMAKRYLSFISSIMLILYESELEEDEIEFAKLELKRNKTHLEGMPNPFGGPEKTLWDRVWRFVKRAQENGKKERAEADERLAAAKSALDELEAKADSSQKRMEAVLARYDLAIREAEEDRSKKELLQSLESMAEQEVSAFDQAQKSVNEARQSYDHVVEVVADSERSGEKTLLYRTLLRWLDKTAEQIAKLHALEELEENPVLIGISRHFLLATRQLLKKSQLSIQEKEKALREQMKATRPHESTATEAFYELLCKIFRESDLQPWQTREICAHLHQHMSLRFSHQSDMAKRIQYAHSQLMRRF